MDNYGIDLKEMLKQAEANGRAEVAEVIKAELKRHENMRRVFASRHDLGFNDLTDVDVKYLKEMIEK